MSLAWVGQGFGPGSGGRGLVSLLACNSVGIGRAFSRLWMLVLRPGFGDWFRGGCCWSTLTAIRLTSLVRDLRASEIGESWCVGVGFCWPVMVLYKLDARSGP